MWKYLHETVPGHELPALLSSCVKLLRAISSPVSPFIYIYIYIYCVCMCIYIYIYIYMCIHICMYVCMCIYIYIYMLCCETGGRGPEVLKSMVLDRLKQVSTFRGTFENPQTRQALQALYEHIL